MWTKSFNFEVIVICFLSLIPWPGPSVFKISCSRESARVVRKIVQSKWLPILEKYQVKIPLECPFHPLRDIFGPQQSAKKQNRPSQWTCGFCGKSFYEEKHLDMHFESRHKSNINMAEDAVCLADYCDIMRCKVLVSKDATLSFGDASLMSTDIEIWREATAYRTALQPTGPRDLAKLPARNNFIPALLRLQSSKLDDEPRLTKKAQQINKNHCNKIDEPNIDGNHNDDDEDDDDEDDEDDEDDDEDILTGSNKKNKSKSSKDGDDGDDSDDGNTTSACDGNLVDSALPPVDRKQQRISELQKMKANCKSEELDKLKMRCEILVRNCIVGLLVKLSDDDFKNMEDELNRAVCWYLTCDRYWEDGPTEQRAFPWGLVFVLVMVLSLGVCFCYYIIWILFDSDDQYGFPLINNSHHSLNLSPTHNQHQHLNAISYQHHHPQLQQQQHQQSHHHQILQQHQLQQHHQLQQQPQAHQQHQLIQQYSQSSSSTGGGTSGISNSGHHNVAVASGSATQAQNPGQTGVYPEEFYGVATDFNEVGQNEHYIYVTYPPELKRRLLESCYNRTTRL